MNAVGSGPAEAALRRWRRVVDPADIFSNAAAVPPAAAPPSLPLAAIPLPDGMLAPVAALPPPGGVHGGVHGGAHGVVVPVGLFG